MGALEIIAIVFMAVGTLYWVLVLYFTIKVIRATPKLEDLDGPTVAASPSVAVIIPTWNQRDDVDGQVRERLLDDYTNLEFVLVDMASDDGTAGVIDEIAASDPRVIAVHAGEALPEDWLPRIYALQRGTEETDAEWYLFSDADTHFEPGAVGRAMSLCDDRELDFLAVVPELYKSKYLLDSLFQVFLRMLLLAERAWAVEKRGSAAVGSAAFNLVRAGALEKAGGLEDLRLDTAEDTSLAQAVKRSGGRCGLSNGRGLVGVHYHGSLREVKVEAEPGLYASLGKCSLLYMFILASLVFLFELGPYFFFLPINVPYHDWIGTAGVVLGIVVSILMCRWVRLPLGAAFYFPIDIFVVFYLIVRAGIVCRRRGGIEYWDRFYSTGMLREGRRFTHR